MLKRRITIHLHGSLRKLWPDPIEVVAATAHEALELVTPQIPGFQPTATGYKRVVVGGCDTYEDLHNPLSSDDLHIYPQLNGGKNGGVTQILVGVALVGLAFVTAGASLAGLGAAVSATMAGGATFGAVMSTTLFMIGVSTVIGGLVTLIMPQPSLGNNATEAEASKYLGVPQSTTKIGTLIRVIYGKRRVGFHYLSFNQNARNYRPST